tara:strand:- start:83 stop:235 length:153 start_codon:yes stop_codon:yes gene_type:complete
VVVLQEFGEVVLEQIQDVVAQAVVEKALELLQQLPELLTLVVVVVEVQVQ